MRVQSLDQEDPLKEGMATHSSILAWRIPWTEEPGGLQSLGSQRVGHYAATEYSHSLRTVMQFLKHELLFGKLCDSVVSRHA